MNHIVRFLRTHIVSGVIVIAATVFLLMGVLYLSTFSVKTCSYENLNSESKEFYAADIISSVTHPDGSVLILGEYRQLIDPYPYYIFSAELYGCGYYYHAYLAYTDSETVYLLPTHIHSENKPDAADGTVHFSSYISSRNRAKYQDMNLCVVAYPPEQQGYLVEVGNEK